MSDYDQRVIVDVAWLERQLPGSGVQILDVRPPAAYANGHIPGALNVPGVLLRLGPGDESDLADQARRGADALARAGVAAEGTVVVYEWGPGALSATVVWFLSFVGHPDARLLDGGLAAWDAAGLAIESGPPTVRSGTLTSRPDAAVLATTDWVRQHLHDPAVIVVDARSPAEHAGEEQRAARAGAIPGSINVEWSHVFAPDGNYRPAEELRTELRGVGIVPEREVVVYCQMGARSSHLYTTLRALGFSRVRNYVGSWSEWAGRPDLPIINEPP